MANDDDDEKQFNELMKRAQEAIDRSREASSSRKAPEARATENGLSDTLEDLRKQNAERFALSQKIRTDVHEVFMSTVGRPLQKHYAEVSAPSAVPFAEVGIAGKKGNLARPIPQFPNRAAWLKARLLERGWSKADPSNFGGPDRKTIEKILRGEAVRNDVLEKLVDALAKKHAKLSVVDVPQD